MSGLFYKIGKKIGQGLIKGQTYYNYLLGDDKESAGAEHLIGSKIARKIISDNSIIRTEEYQQQIDQIGARLVDQLTNVFYKYHFYILETSDVNAFAVPGGFIFITSELYNKIRNQADEIAFVFAHEIMHISLKHPLKKILTNYSGKVVGNLLSKNSAIGMMVNKVIKDLFISTYSRDKEMEADKQALNLMYKAGYNPHSAQKLLQKLTQKEKNTKYTYFSSHPATKRRISEVNNIATRLQESKSE